MNLSVTIFMKDKPNIDIYITTDSKTCEIIVGHFLITANSLSKLNKYFLHQ